MDLVTKHQQVDAERDHAKSELEQFMDDITRAMKQKGLLEKALGKKVLNQFYFVSSLLMVDSPSFYC